LNALRTIVKPEKPPFNLSHADKLLSVGSCFSENIGLKFRDYKFAININPFGQQYNPYSISRAIERLLEPVLYSGNDLVYHDELYHSFDHHGSFSRPTESEALQVINDNLQKAAEDLQTATCLLLTFGTSHVFSLKEDRQIVSNCHKLSGNAFEKRLMQPQEITELLEAALTKVLALRPGIKIILTISPVRYFAFGHYENSVSKAHLFTAVYELQKRHPECYYFPAYELVMDDLRDYRFFAEDMLHPNHQATEYVWENLVNTLLAAKTTALLQDIDEILLAAQHRPRNPESEAHKAFARKMLQKVTTIKKQHGLDFAAEENKLNAFLF